MTRRELIFPILILMLGAFFRFYLITEIPPGLYPDEAANGNNAVEALRTGEFKIFYPENNGREGLFINLQAIAIGIFGAEPWVLRLVSAIFGTLTILGLYLLAKELFAVPKPQIQNSEPESKNYDAKSENFKLLPLTFDLPKNELIALLASFLLATSYWHINFSRIGFRAILVPFFSVFGMYWLLKALRTGKISSVVLAGIFTGLGFYTYIAFRFVPFVLAAPIIFFLSRWLAQRKTPAPTGYPADDIQNKRQSCTPCAVALFILVAFVVGLPLGLYFVQNPADFFGRSTQVSIFSAANPLYEFVKSNALTLQMFFWRGDCNARHNFACQPELFWPAAIFFAVGLAIAVRNIVGKTTNYKLQTTILLVWFIFMLFPATLTREGIPHALRSIGLIPPVFLIAGWGAEFLLTSALNYLDRKLAEPQWQERRTQIKRIQKEITALLALLLIFTAIDAYRTYFVRFPENPNSYYAFATDLVHIGQYINALPETTRKIVIVNLSGDIIRGIKAPAQTPMFISDTFSEEKRIAKRVEYIHSADEISIRPDEKTAILPLDGGDRELIAKVKTKFPGFKTKIPGDFISFEN